MVGLPLVVRLALWASAQAAGVDGDRDDPWAHAGITDLAGDVDTLTDWLEAGERLFLPALPRPGHLAGMPRTEPEALDAALDASQAVVAATLGGLLVPMLEPFGPPGDRGLLASVTAYPAQPLPRHVIEATDAAALARWLTESVLEATSTLESIGGTPWRPWETQPEPARPMAAGLSAGLVTRAARATHLIGRAATVRELAADGIELELAQPALDATTSARRVTALRTLAGVADEVLVGAATVAAAVLAGWLPGGPATSRA